MCVASFALGCSSREHPGVFVPPDSGVTHLHAGKPDASDSDAQTTDDAGDAASTPVGGGATIDPSLVYVLAPNKATNKWGLSLASDPGGSALAVGSGFDRYQFLNDAVIYNGPGGSPVYQVSTGKTDALVATPPCPTAKGASSILTGPNGRFIYNCADGQPWYDGGTQVYGGQAALLALGNADLALASQDMGLTSGVVNLKDEQFHVISPALSPGSILGVRAIESGFELAVDSIDSAELFHVDAQGVATSVGSYPNLPAMTQVESGGLATDKTLFELTKQGDVFAIYKHALGADPVLVLTDNADSPLTLSFALILTGP